MIKYPKVLQANIITAMNLVPKGTFYVQEKVDGSQFRFGQDRKGNRFFGSKGVEYNASRPPDKMFLKAVASANEALDRVADLIDGVDTYFIGEYLRTPKHNTLTYERVPQGNIVVFDMIEEGVYMKPEVIRRMALDMGLEPVANIGNMNKFPPFNTIDPFLRMRTSSLGGSIIEGVVIKNYEMMVEVNNEVRPVIYKYVRDDFKEMNEKEWKTHPGRRPIEDEVGEIFNKDAIFAKAVQHLKENGEYTGEMRDMQKLIPLVYEDLYEEYKPQIEEMIWKHYQKDFERSIVRGLPEYYKKYLYGQVEKSINGGD